MNSDDEGSPSGKMSGTLCADIADFEKMAALNATAKKGPGDGDGRQRHAGLKMGGGLDGMGLGGGTGGKGLDINALAGALNAHAEEEEVTTIKK